MTKKNRQSANDPEQQRMKAESTEAGRKAERNQPSDIVQRSLMQRQSKHLHEKDGKKTPGE